MMVFCYCFSFGLAATLHEPEARKRCDKDKEGSRAKGIRVFVKMQVRGSCVLLSLIQSMARWQMVHFIGYQLYYHSMKVTVRLNRGKMRESFNARCECLERVHSLGSNGLWQNVIIADDVPHV